MALFTVYVGKHKFTFPSLVEAEAFEKTLEQPENLYHNVWQKEGSDILAEC